MSKRITIAKKVRLLRDKPGLKALKEENFFLKYFMIALCAVFMPGFTGLSYASQNLLSNPGFEEMDEETGFARDWEPLYWSHAPHGEIAVSDKARTGKHSVRLTGVPDHPRKSYNHLVAQWVEVPEPGEHNMLLSVWFRAEEDGVADLSVMTEDAEGNRLNYMHRGHVRGQVEDIIEWDRLEFNFTTCPGTARIRVMLRNWHGGEGSVWYDDASLVVTDIPPLDLPTVDEMEGFPKAEGFFPYGEYFRGYSGHVFPEEGDVVTHTRRQLRSYRRAYMNTYLVGEFFLMPQFTRDGKSSVADLTKEFDMKLFPRAEMMRRFRREKGKALEEFSPPFPITREAALERIEEVYSIEERRRFVEEYGDMILAYDFSDEPGGMHVPLYRKIQNIYREEVDPDNPVLVILNIERREYLPYMPIYYGDTYPIRNTSRNPWYIYRIVREMAVRTPAPVWVMLQAFGGQEDYRWHLPTGPEMRLMLYGAIAGGAKGLTFHGSGSPPVWRFNRHYHYASIDSFLAETPVWEAMRGAGRHITAAGPALLTSDVTDDEVLSIRSGSIKTEFYDGPALKAGVLKRREGGWFAVLVNQDIERAQTGRAAVNTGVAGDEAGIFDLHRLGGEALSGLEITLEPGDGRIYFVGTDRQARDVLSIVHRSHYDNELPLYEIDANLAEANNCDVELAAEAKEAAGRAYAGGRYAEAHKKIAEAREKVAESIEANMELSSALKNIGKAHDLLSDIAHVYRDNFDFVVPPEERKKTPRNHVWKNESDPRMQEYNDRTAEAFYMRLALEDRLYAGEASQAASEAEKLLETARRLHREAIAYVESNR
jgi:hypothetical protein